MLENINKSYEFKIAGGTQLIDISTDSIVISLNRKDLGSPQNLIGSTINKT